MRRGIFSFKSRDKRRLRKAWAWCRSTNLLKAFRRDNHAQKSLAFCTSLASHLRYLPQTNPVVCLTIPPGGPPANGTWH